jgi:hypothetical protein
MPELRKTRSIGEIATLPGVSRQNLHRVMAGEIAINLTWLRGSASSAETAPDSGCACRLSTTHGKRSID